MVTVPMASTLKSHTPSIEQLHSDFLEILPRIELHAQIRFRYLRCHAQRDDAIAEVIGVCWKWFLRIKEQGKDVNEFVSTLADYAVRHVRSGRRVCGQDRTKDVLSPRARRLNNFKIERLPSSTACKFSNVYADPHGQDTSTPSRNVCEITLRLQYLIR